MSTYNVHAAKTHLSKLLARVDAGEEIVIARSGRPVARLVPYAPKRRERRPGRWAGRITLGPDFDATLTDSDLRAWIDGDVDPTS